MNFDLKKNARVFLLLVATMSIGCGTPPLPPKQSLTTAPVIQTPSASIPAIAPATQASTQPDHPVTFDVLTATVLKPYKCVGCHDFAKSEEAFQEYVNADPDKSDCYKQIKSGKMPKKMSITTDERNAILKVMAAYTARLQNQPDVYHGDDPTD